MARGSWDHAHQRALRHHCYSGLLPLRVALPRVVCCTCLEVSHPYDPRPWPGPRLTTNPAADVTPSWSPDGKSIAFMRQEFLSSGESSSEIYLIPALGGAERRLTAAAKAFLEDGRRQPAFMVS